MTASRVESSHHPSHPSRSHSESRPPSLWLIRVSRVNRIPSQSSQPHESTTFRVSRVIRVIRVTTTILVTLTRPMHGIHGTCTRGVHHISCLQLQIKSNSIHTHTHTHTLTHAPERRGGGEGEEEGCFSQRHSYETALFPRLHSESRQALNGRILRAIHAKRAREQARTGDLIHSCVRLYASWGGLLCCGQLCGLGALPPRVCRLVWVRDGVPW